MQADPGQPYDGTRDHARAVEELAGRLPEPLRPLAGLAYDYRWSWTPGGRELFRDLDARRFAGVDENPVRLLRGLPQGRLDEAAADESIVRRAGELADRFAGEGGPAAPPRVAFLCAEFGVHPSLPTYSGGLGVLAGDYLKEASDQGFPLVAFGLLYRRGYFHQRIDMTGWQRESWDVSDPELLPAARVTGSDGSPLRIRVPVWEGDLAADVWRAQVGRVPLYLLDADVEENTPVERWVTSRLYEGTRPIRLAQYALLGIGAVRALDAMGIEPETVHLNEGHPALAAVELAARTAPAGTPLPEALEHVRERFVFTTHTPVAAGNETYARDEFLSVLGRVPTGLGFGPEELVRLARVRPDDDGSAPGLTPLAIRAARDTVGVSRRHGEVSREMWRGLTTEEGRGEIGHVTNGVHLPSWMAPELRSLLESRWGEGWERRALDPGLWDAVDDIPDHELWGVRATLRSRLVEVVRERVVTERLARGEEMPAVLAAETLFDGDALTVGFARRLAAYKRLGLLVQDPERTFALLSGPQPVQFVIAGKAHPLDDAGKALAQELFAVRQEPAAAGRLTFVEDYDLRIAPTLVSGCDVWLNVPRPPLEASGTSGMKAALNGTLNLSVLDGWWPEAFDGENGWGLDGSVDPDEPAQDARHARELFETLENEVLPAFYERDEAGVPRAWVAKMKRSLKTVGSTFTTARMLADYRRLYRS